MFVGLVSSTVSEMCKVSLNCMLDEWRGTVNSQRQHNLGHLYVKNGKGDKSFAVLLTPLLWSNENKKVSHAIPIQSGLGAFGCQFKYPGATRNCYISSLPPRLTDCNSQLFKDTREAARKVGTGHRGQVLTAMTKMKKLTGNFECLLRLQGSLHWLHNTTE